MQKNKPLVLPLKRCIKAFFTASCLREKSLLSAGCALERTHRKSVQRASELSHGTEMKSVGDTGKRIARAWFLDTFANFDLSRVSAQTSLCSDTQISVPLTASLFCASLFLSLLRLVQSLMFNIPAALFAATTCSNPVPCVNVN